MGRGLSNLQRSILTQAAKPGPDAVGRKRKEILVRELLERCRVSKSAVSRALRRLQWRGLIRPRMWGERTVKITDAGREAVGRRPRGYRSTPGS
jgi:DNA-binding MarR family transcriptional regulator